jgi:hypothetical protein
MRLARRTALLVAFSLFTSAATASADEPTGFAEFPWGTPRSDLIVPCTSAGKVYQTPGLPPMKLPARPPDLFPLGEGLAELNCSRTIVLGGEERGVRLTLVRDQLAGYRFWVRSSLYSDLMAIAVDKFGIDNKASTKTYRTRGGTDASGRLHEWIWPSGTTAYVEELCEKLTLSCLVVSAKSLHDWYATTRSQEIERAKKRF